MHSFTEFFRLINYKKPADPVLALSAPPELVHEQYDFIANQLAEAEIAQRRSDLARASAAYLALADEFSAKGDLARAVSFYEKCYPFASKVGNFEEQVLLRLCFVCALCHCALYKHPKFNKSSHFFIWSCALQLFFFMNWFCIK